MVVSADSIAHSLGAVLLQEDRPIEFAAKSLTETQQRYSQIEKELLAVVFACKRYKYYLWGRELIMVETDHQPLIGLMQKPTAQLSPRLAHMRLELSYLINVQLKFKPGKDLILAVVMSCTCPAGTDMLEDLGSDPLFQVCELILQSDATMQEYKEATMQDDQLQVVMTYIREGWPAHKRSCA